MHHRAAGILLPVASLPGPYPIGDVGRSAERFIDFLAAAGQSTWAVLPVTIPDGLGSPFASVSAFAGNWLLVSPERLARRWGLKEETQGHLVDRVDYRAAHAVKRHWIGRAFKQFRKHATDVDRSRFAAFREREKDWLDDFALFMAIKDREHGRPWFAWPAGLRDRDPKTLANWTKRHGKEREFFAFGQWLFNEQWSALRAYARKRGVSLLGNLPHFVRHDSVDVWQHRGLFRLRADGSQETVAGVPPDQFTPLGQRWGNPLYDWDRHAADGFAWWRARLRRALTLYDSVLLDHFRGFADVYAIPADEPDARHGSWEPAPGETFLAAIRRSFPRATLIAEDLGNITPEVVALRQRSGMLGTHVLLFEIGSTYGGERTADCVTFTGTHDNATAREWIMETATSEERRRALERTKSSPETFARALIERGMYNPSPLFLTPLHDVLNLGKEARLNTPGTTVGNWTWRPNPARLTDALAQEYATLTRAAGRTRPRQHGD